MEGWKGRMEKGREGWEGEGEGMGRGEGGSGRKGRVGKG